MEKALAWLIVVAIAIFAIVVLIGVVTQYRSCNEHGGVLVRGLFGYECVSR